MQTRTILELLGFTEDWTAITDQLPGYRYHFGSWELTAAQVCDRYLRPVFYFGGVISTPRTISMVEFEIPLEVESFEQGVAWICYGIDRDYHPANPVPWLKQGRAWRSHLPWVRQMEAFNARPQCSVESEWFRVAAKKLRGLSETATEGELACFAFDGEILRIKACGSLLAMPATGKAWDRGYYIEALRLDFLPKRFSSVIYLGIWEERLTIARRCFKLAEPQDGNSQA